MPEKKPEIWSESFYEAVGPRVRVEGFQQAEPGWHFRPRRTLIRDFDLWYVTRGRGAVRIDDRWVRFGAGDLVAIMPGQRFREERTDDRDPFVLYFVHVLPFGEDPAGFAPLLADRWPAKMSMRHQVRLAPLFADLFDAFTMRPEGYTLRMKSLMLRILEIVFETLRGRGHEHRPPGYTKLIRARDYVVRCNRRDLTLEEIAEHADLSASYLASLFRRYLGRSPIQYQIEIRLRSARRLLAEGRRVSDVAREVGFHSLHYFSRTFKRHGGLSPSQFAEMCRRK